MKNEKGVMGLDTARSFIIGILALVIIGVVMLIVLVQLNDTSIVASTTNTVINETGAWINSSGYTLDTATVSGFANPTLTALYNDTSGNVITLANATLSSAGIMTNATAITWKNVSVSYTYETPSDTENVILNATKATSTLFEDTTVWLSLLGVVIIILIIAAVVVVVNRFGSNAQPVL